jgi:uncharacterized protein
MAPILLTAAVVLSLLLVPVGLPGTWLMIAAALTFNAFSPANRIGWFALTIAIVLAFLAEVFEWTLASRFVARYGGSRRAGWGAFIGGIVGALVGVPLPVIGSMIGAFVGAFAGALVAEYTRSVASGGSAMRVATGALLGRMTATAMKMAIAFTIAVVIVTAGWT